MSDAIKTFNLGFGVTVEGHYNSFPEHPADWDLCGSPVRIVHSHPDYDIGGSLGDYRPDRPEVTELEGKFWRPLYAYERGILRLSLGDFGDPWDSGQVGWVGVAEDFDGTPAEANAEIEYAVAQLGHYYAGDNYLYQLLVFGEVEDSNTFTGDFNEGFADAKMQAEYLIPHACRKALRVFVPGLEVD